MVTFGGIPLDLLLVGEGMLAAEQVEVRHGGGRVGAPEQRGDDDAPGGTQRDLVGECPARGLHRGVDVLLLAVEGQIDGVAEDAVARPGASDEVVGHIPEREELMDPGNRQVGCDQPENREMKPPEPVPREGMQQHDDGEPGHQRQRQQDEEGGDHIPDGGALAPAHLGFARDVDGGPGGNRVPAATAWGSRSPA